MRYRGIRLKSSYRCTKLLLPFICFLRLCKLGVTLGEQASAVELLLG